MGLLVEGKWVDEWYDTDSTGGRFERDISRFRNWITPDGSAGPTGSSGFNAEADRYHLYVSLACPWAHRTLIFRKLKKLESLIPVTVVEAHMLENGWEFKRPAEQFKGIHVKGAQEEPLFGFDFTYQLYQKAHSEYSGRVTVPILWDKKNNTIVSNESADIIRMFNSAFNDITGETTDFYPEELKQEIDVINEFVYHNVNNGVYKTGFSTTQDVYEEEFNRLFDALDQLESRLGKQQWLVGDTLTEADWRLFTTLVRFDAVYVGHFKTNKKRIEDYPNLSHYTRALYQHPGVAETVSIEHIKEHYYYSHDMINPTRVVPKGPELNFDAPHNRFD